jgi:hypothetical protein
MSQVLPVVFPVACWTRENNRENNKGKQGKQQRKTTGKTGKTTGKTTVGQGTAVCPLYFGDGLQCSVRAIQTLNILCWPSI